MATDDTCCTIVPYFKIHNGQEQAFRALCQRCIEVSRKEPKCLYYGFSFDGELAHCREGYEDADGALEHLENIGPLLQEVLQVADLVRLEVHGPETELTRLRESFAEMKPKFFQLEYAFRR